MKSTSINISINNICTLYCRHHHFTDQFSESQLLKDAFLK
jgi:hypothetical protein